jgi:hypothetical protein
MKFVSFLRKHNNLLVKSALLNHTAADVAEYYKLAYKHLTSNNDFVPPAQVARAKLLVIDEVFLFPSYIFILADVICRGARDAFTKSFGGLTLIMVGDPLQGAAIADESIMLELQSGSTDKRKWVLWARLSQPFT